MSKQNQTVSITAIVASNSYGWDFIFDLVIKFCLCKQWPHDSTFIPVTRDITAKVALRDKTTSRATLEEWSHRVSCLQTSKLMFST